MGDWRRTLSFSPKSRAEADAGGDSFVRAGGGEHLHVRDVDDDVFQSWVFYSPRGLRVHLLKREPRLQAVGGIQPLYVRLEWRGDNHRPNLLVDSQSVAWEDLGKVLQTGLLRRPPSWPVYVEADRDVEWESAVKAIDVVRGLHAEVTLLTGRR
jgi:phosphatidate phosphatase APP1